jgi:hypothetical protein
MSTSVSSIKTTKNTISYNDGVLNQVMSKLNKSRQLRELQAGKEKLKRNSLLIASSYRKVNKLCNKFMSSGSTKNLHH